MKWYKENIAKELEEKYFDWGSLYEEFEWNDLFKWTNETEVMLFKPN